MVQYTMSYLVWQYADKETTTLFNDLDTSTFSQTCYLQVENTAFMQ